MRHIVRVLVVLLTAAVIAACGSKQIRQDQKDNFNLQVNAWSVQQSAVAALVKEAVVACKEDANPGLCVNYAIDKLTQNRTGMPRAPAPYQSPATQVFASSLNTLNHALTIWGGIEKDKNFGEILANVSGNAGTHVQGDFINGWQDNSDNSDNSVDNSVAVGGNLGDTYGDDYTGGDRSETNTEFSGSGPAIVDSTDVTVGDANENSGNIGTENRQDSDGDFDNSDDGDDCSGESCNPVEPADPIDP